MMVFISSPSIVLSLISSIHTLYSEMGPQLWDLLLLLIIFEMFLHIDFSPQPSVSEKERTLEPGIHPD